MTNRSLFIRLYCTRVFLLDRHECVIIDGYDSQFWDPLVLLPLFDTVTKCVYHVRAQDVWKYPQGRETLVSDFRSVYLQRTQYNNSASAIADFLFSPLSTIPPHL